MNEDENENKKAWDGRVGPLFVAAMFVFFVVGIVVSQLITLLALLF